MSASLSTHPLSSYESRDIGWLWDRRIPLGKVTLIAGDPGLGKSFISLDMAARLSVGAPMPGQMPGQGTSHTPIKGGTLLLSAEDDPGDTLRPRLETLGANLDKIHMVPSVCRVNHNVSPYEQEFIPFQLDRHVRMLDDQLAEYDHVRLVVIDPISAYMGETDSHNNAQVRSVLGRLAQVAGRRDVAIVCITHLNKGGGGSGKAVYRAMGSLAFAAAARVVHQVSKDPNDASRRLMIPVKANICGDVGGLAYRIAPPKEDRSDSMADVPPTIQWEDQPVSISADELESENAGEKIGQLEEAVAWLEERLKDGPVGASVVIEEGESMGLSAKTLNRAKTRLRIKSQQHERQWSWSLPG